jgi:hypothetical protein
LKYVGRVPDSDATLANKAYADVDNANTAVTNAFIDQQVANQGHDLVNQAFVDQQVANYAPTTAVDAALSAYAPITALGVASGVAQADGTGLIPSAQLPTLVTNRLALSYNIATTGTNFLGSASYTTTTTNVNEYIIASIPIPDPGFAWYPLAFAYISAQTGGSSSGSRFVGNGNFGYLTVSPPAAVSATIYAAGICTDSPITNWYQAMPSAIASNTTQPQTPTNTPPILGGLTLNLAACCWQGNAYTWNGPGLVFHIIVIPAIGTGQLPH